MFQHAKPIWVTNCNTEMNIVCGYRADIDFSGGEAQLYITGATFYHIYINGNFFNYGPARCAHGVFREDCFDITPYLKKGKNCIAFEMCGYNINSFEFLDQPSFLLAEIFIDKKSVFATGKDPVEVFKLTHRVQKIQRHSFQRCFAECYRLSQGFNSWRIEGTSPLETEIFNMPKIISRNIPLFIFEDVTPATITQRGRVEFFTPKEYIHNRLQTNISFDFPVLKGYKYEEEEIHLSDELQEHLFVKENLDSDDKIENLTFKTFEWSSVRAGFICLDFSCEEDTVFYIRFDEKLLNDDINPKEDNVNALKIEAQKGRYSFMSSNIYSFKYLKIYCVKGSITLENLHIKTLECPVEITATYPTDDYKLKAVFDAAVMSFKENSTDIFMDCPGRERAGWLCDSFFTARTEKILTGKNIIEKNFLQNFTLVDDFEYIPHGMLPMCYPADHGDGLFIPNWAMWFIIELEDYYNRTKDSELVDAAKQKVYGVLKYLSNFENEFGLLENLESWVFLEWSEASSLTQDVNYPTNMLYAFSMKLAGKLYKDSVLTEKAEKLASVIKERSFNGEFFVDSEKRESHTILPEEIPPRMSPQKKDYSKDGKLVLVNEISETCQYYAFFCEIATPDSHQKLWNKLLNDFGPDRAKKGLYPEIYAANAFIGNYLRLDLLSRYGEKERLLEETRDYFYYMAERTGTLWEYISTEASCNHGFASYIAYLLKK